MWEGIIMANWEQIDRLLASSQEWNHCHAWNQWRMQCPGIVVDLGHANLSGANLSGADLSRAYLEGVNLQTCQMQGAQSRLTI